MTANRVMIIDDQAASREYLVRIIHHENLAAEIFPDGASAREALRENPEDLVLVITRFKLPDISGLELAREICSELPVPPPFIVIAKHDARQEIIQAFKHGAFDFFSEPFSPREIGAALARARQLRQNREKNFRAYRHLREKRLHFEIDNDLGLVQPLVNVVAAEIGSCCRISPRRLDGLKMGLHELLVNAIEHGNLEISSTLKERPDYLQYLRRRARADPYRNRRVTLEARIAPQGFSCTIRDQGAGFNWQNLPHPGTPDNLGKAHGRGIAMAGSFFDEFIFNPAGNEVTVKKNLKPHPPEPAAPGN